MMLVRDAGYGDAGYRDAGYGDAAFRVACCRVAVGAEKAFAHSTGLAAWANVCCSLCRDFRCVAARRAAVAQTEKNA